MERMKKESMTFQEFTVFLMDYGYYLIGENGFFDIALINAIAKNKGFSVVGNGRKAIYITPKNTKKGGN